MYKIDKTDAQLIQLLENNARQSSKALAKQLYISSPTVRRRLNRLIKNGILHFVAISNLRVTGFILTAMVALNVDHSCLDSVMNKLASRQEVKWVATTTGRFDVLVLVQFLSTEELSSFLTKELTKVEGVKGSETFICLVVSRKWWKKTDRYIPLRTS